MRLAAALVPALFFAASALALEMEYWDFPRHGTTLAGTGLSEAKLEGVKARGHRLFSLIPNGWPSAQKDFLIADADDFKRLMPADLETLLAALVKVDRAGLRVIVSMRSLPGARAPGDARLFTDDSFIARAAEFWRRLAIALKGHPAVAAYELFHEPPDHASVGRIYERLAAAVRSVDGATPIVFAAPKTLSAFAPISDSKALYAFSGSDLSELEKWQKRHGLPSSRIVVSALEPPAGDTKSLLQKKGWHWIEW
jgi:hypothetical protein